MKSRITAQFRQGFADLREQEQILSIPVHCNQDLKVGTLKALMKIAQLFENDLL